MQPAPPRLCYRVVGATMLLSVLLRALGTMASLLDGAAEATATTAGRGSKPHIVMVLQDDLGHHDVGFGGGGGANITQNVTKLAEEGVILTAHYVFYWCSPTRRSFLTGRLPVHHGEMLSDYHTDDIDLRWTTIAEKLKKGAGYKSFWFGKGHTGYRSTAHLPVNLGFDGHVGFLIGQQSYTSTDRWMNDRPYHNGTYSTTLYGDASVAAITAHDAAAAPLFLYLPWQAVHDPYDPVPGCDCNSTDQHGINHKDNLKTYRCMLWASDVQMGRVVTALKAKDMWATTVFVYSADNGGISSLSGNNYPYRGEKRTSFEGGMRAAAFVSGGALPSQLRGTSSGLRMHVVE